jgi:hypothetical protein
MFYYTAHLQRSYFGLLGAPSGMNFLARTARPIFVLIETRI